MGREGACGRPKRGGKRGEGREGLGERGKGILKKFRLRRANFFIFLLVYRPPVGKHKTKKNGPPQANFFKVYTTYTVRKHTILGSPRVTEGGRRPIFVVKSGRRRKKTLKSAAGENF